MIGALAVIISYEHECYLLQPAALSFFADSDLRFESEPSKLMVGRTMIAPIEIRTALRDLYRNKLGVAWHLDPQINAAGIIVLGARYHVAAFLLQPRPPVCPAKTVVHQRMYKDLLPRRELVSYGHDIAPPEVIVTIILELCVHARAVLHRSGDRR